MFRKAEKKKAKLRLAITGVAGSGKTYGALKVAQGLGGKIAMIDTENGSGDLYSDKFDYDVCSITAPYTVQKYLQASEILPLKKRELPASTRTAQQFLMNYRVLHSLHRRYFPYNLRYVSLLPEYLSLRLCLCHDVFHISDNPIL